LKSPIEKLLPIKTLSYWRFTRLKKCWLSGAYPASVQTSVNYHLANTRSQILGKIFHSQMETMHDLLSQGCPSGPEFRTAFNNVIDRVAAEVATDPSSRHLGDIRLWPELAEIYKSLSRMVERRRNAPHSGNVQVHSEEMLYSKDKQLSGQLDAFFTDENGIDLVDYKSGAITDGDQPKEDYVNQLYFYAYLLSENYGIYPRSLTLTGKNLESLKVDTSEERSEELAGEMRSLLAEYNSTISQPYSLDKLTNPSSSNCLFCDAKLVCRKFWEAADSMELPQWAHAVIGVQTSVMERSKRGGCTLDLDIEIGSIKEKKIKVTRIFETRFPEFQDNVGQRVMLLNLRLLCCEPFPIAEATERTTIFALPGTSS
jgi:hypothetical protein